MASIEEMSIEELKEFIEKIPTQSACDRANKEKLKLFLANKIAKEEEIVSQNP